MNYKQKRLTKRQKDIQHEKMLLKYFQYFLILLGIEIAITLLYAAFDMFIYVDVGITIIFCTFALKMAFIMFDIFTYQLIKLG